MPETINKIDFTRPVNERRFDFNQEELSSLELTARMNNKINEIIDFINNLGNIMNGYELSSNITNNRKLSPTGNFTGTLMGRSVFDVLAELDDDSDKIKYLTNQFADGQTGLVIDGGFFEATGIDKNYDGGRF